MSNDMVAMTAGETPGGGRAAIECRGVWYRANGGRPLVAGLNLRIARGETLVLLGRSGSGKTTTLKLINRLLEPSEGAVLVENRPTTEWDPIHLRRGIGYVIQEAGLFPHLTVARNVGLVPNLEGWPAEKIGTRIALLAEGKLVAVRVPAEFLHSPEPEVQAFVSSLQGPGGSGAH